jgi:hypothetical protein
MKRFHLTGIEKNGVEIAQNVARTLLKQPNIQPQQIIGLGNALFSLDRLPMITPGSCCEFGICYEAGDKEYREMRYIEFRISDQNFEISTGGSVYDKAVGSDSILGPYLTFELGGYRQNQFDDCDLYNLENEVQEYLNLGAQITVSDESEVLMDDYQE